MLSICIPVYNFNVTELVYDLHNQAVALSIPFEIILADDASREYFRAINSKITLDHVQYIQLEKNIGRSGIRNLLVTKTNYPYLIFMDCDSAVSSDNYIKNYLPYCKPFIVCYGGRIYKKEKPEQATLLRWKYGIYRESFPASKRKLNPNFGFCTNNFLIDKEVFQTIYFNEDLIGYGHEDTLFGLELLGKGITIEHIDNPLIHLGLESFDAFLEKTENGLVNLHKIELILNEKHPELAGHSKLMRSKKFLIKMHLNKMIAYSFKVFRPFIRKNLEGNNPSLFLFDLYKLGLLISY